MAPRVTETGDDAAVALRGRWESLLELLPGVVFEQRTNLAFVEIGPGAERFFGSRAGALNGPTDLFLSCIHEDDRVSVLSWLKRLSGDGSVCETTYRLVHPDSGDIFHVADIRRQAPGDPSVFRGIWMDRTNQIRAEKRLTYRAWKETVSTVTSGLLHDFNNVIAGIFSISELYHSLITPDHEMHAGIGQIKASSMEAQKLVRRIMELNREVSGERSIFNFEHLIADQLDFLRAILPRGTRIEDHFTGEELPVRVDDVGFRQVLLNLATNARDALQEDGCIEITSRRHQASGPGPAGVVPADFHYPAGSVELIFRDNGCGMPARVVERIFDPFFSTKDPSRGSGLGLYNAHLFAEANKGQIGVITSPGEGTSFHLVLPEETFDEAAGATAPSAPAEEKRHHVLLYSWEDTAQTELVGRMRDQSWQVLTLTNARRAREYLTQSIFPIDLAVIMRIALDDNADRLLEQIRREHPRIRIAVITMGEDPDHVPKVIGEKADLVLHHNLKLSTMIARLTEMIG